MDTETLFSICSVLVAPGWALLVFAPGWKLGARIIAPFVIPVVLGLTYATLIVMALPSAEGGFSSLADVRVLFADDKLLLAGWIHYLAFDLFIGSWEVRDARARGIPHVAIVPFLLATFLLGPVGLVGYLALRAGVSRKAAHAA
ncbi:MAG: ABA4-like family protein [Planctomycetota bacterium]|nr:ABA4-like family protein [Planctomycetota bacterium]